MDLADFERTRSDIWDTRKNLANRRNDLEMELSETRNKIAHLDEVLNHLAALTGTSTTGDLAGLGITDAIRAVVRIKGERMSPQDVRERLTEHGFDMSDLTAPMASIYKILSRLADDPNECLQREKEDGRVFYKYTGITDEDIPF